MKRQRTNTPNILDSSRLPPNNPAAVRQQRRSILLDSNHGYTYSTKLQGHDGCVNAIEYSAGDGRFLASAGDDSEVLVWDLHSDLTSPEALRIPSAKFVGHRANIFALAFDCTSRHIFSGGVDSCILRYDISRLQETGGGRQRGSVPESEDSRNLFHEYHVSALSAHPDTPNILLAASKDRSLALHDFRVPLTAVQRIVSTDAWTGTSWSPVGGHLFAGSDEGGHLRLYDSRQSFTQVDSSRPSAGESRASMARQSPPVMNYLTSLTRYRAGSSIAPDLSGVDFSPDGSMLATNVLRYRPVIYAVGDAVPLATLSGEKYPNGDVVRAGEPTYVNRCTTKHASFGRFGTYGLVYSTGSDDFHAYGWSIPSASSLLDARTARSQPLERVNGTEIGFSLDADSDVVFPNHLNQPLFRLEGAQTIVNSALVHPRLPLIATAGVERSVTLHSTYSSSVPPNTTPSARDPSAFSTLEPSQRIQAQQSWRRENPDWKTLLMFDDFVRDGGVEDAVDYGLAQATFGWDDLDLEEEDGREGNEHGDTLLRAIRQALRSRDLGAFDEAMADAGISLEDDEGEGESEEEEAEEADWEDVSGAGTGPWMTVDSSL